MPAATNRQITLIVAALMPNLGIGYQGSLPWRLAKEMKYFKAVTTSTPSKEHLNAVIMGRRTWESIPNKFKPLPDRINVVLSRDVTRVVIPENLKDSHNIILSDSIENALLKLESYKLNRIFIIGGAQIYNESISHPSVTRLLLTEIKSEEPIEMDTFLDFAWCNSAAPVDPSVVESPGSWVKRSQLELQKFVGDDVELPQQDVVEKGFTYNYTMWERI